MALPCLVHYYRAAQLRTLVCCCDPGFDAKWKSLEQTHRDIPLQSILGDKTLQKNI